MDVRVQPVLESRRKNGRVCAGEWSVEIEIEAAVDRGVGLAGVEWANVSLEMEFGETVEELNSEDKIQSVQNVVFTVYR